jgi:hypothetical protein
MATPLIGGKSAPTEAQPAQRPPVTIINTPPNAGESVTLA